MARYECDIDTHGKQQLELKMAYPVAQRGWAKYQLDLFIFCPYQLGVATKGGGGKRFLEDVISYTRYSPPSLPLSQLVNSDCLKSPLARLAGALDGPLLDERNIMYELRMLANIFHRQMREANRSFKAMAKQDCPAAEAGGWLENFLLQVQAVLEAYRQRILPRFNRPDMPPTLRQAAEWAAEQTSLSAEKQYFRFYAQCQRWASLKSVAQIMESRLGQESQYRGSRGYSSVVSVADDRANENFLYRAGMLKKWAEGCMYMSVERSRVADQVAQVFLGVAAGLAMLFAVAATFLASKWFPPDSIPWAILIVVMYVFKDRIKDWLRGLFMLHLPQLVADKTEDLFDQRAGRKIGGSRIRARLLPLAQAPADVVKLRYHSTNEFRPLLPEEDVIAFHKQTRFDCGILAQHHSRLESITEILRFKLDSFMSAMDDPVNNLSYFRHGSFAQVQARRVYHLSLVLRLAEEGKPERTYFHYRLVLNREGIVDVEHVASTDRP